MLGSQIGEDNSEDLSKEEYELKQSYHNFFRLFLQQLFTKRMCSHYLWIVVHGPWSVVWVYQIVPLCVLFRWFHQAGFIKNFGVEHLCKHALGESCKGGAIRVEDDAFDVDADDVVHDDSDVEEGEDDFDDSDEPTSIGANSRLFQILKFSKSAKFVPQVESDGSVMVLLWLAWLP